MTYSIIKEKNEAIRSGEEALSCLKEAYSELEGARTWGVIDMLGGSFLSSYIKRGRMNRAQESINRADRALQVFSKELNDVGNLADINVNTHDLLGLADLLYENFFVDYLMQGRIKTAKKQVGDAIQAVETALEQLDLL